MLRALIGWEATGDVKGSKGSGEGKCKDFGFRVSRCDMGGLKEYSNGIVQGALSHF